MPAIDDEAKKSAYCDVLKSDKQCLRSLILFQHIRHHEETRFEAYNTMCEEIGQNVLNFLEFDFWLNRFENGNFDLNVDEDEIPAEGLLNYMPVHIIQKILTYLSLEDKIYLRLVNRALQNVIDQEELFCKFACISIPEECSDTFTVKFGDRLVEIKGEPDKEPICMGDNGVLFPESPVNLFERALLQIPRLLNHPNLHFHEMHILVDICECKPLGSLEGKISKAFGSIGHQMSAENLFLSTYHCSLYNEILPHFKPGILKKISLWKGYGHWENKALEATSKTEQWKKAENIAVSFHLSYSNYKAFAHLKYFDVQANIPPTHLLRLRDLLIASPVFKRGRYHAGYLQKLKIKPLEDALGPFTPRDPRKWNTRHYPIPGTNEFLAITINLNEVVFERTF